MNKLSDYTLEDYLKSLQKDENIDKDANFVVLQKNIRHRQHKDIVEIGDHLTVNDMRPPLVFAFLHYFLFFWDHIEPHIADDKEKDFIKFAMNDIMNGNKPDAEKLNTH